MNTLSPRSEKRRPTIPLLWAIGGTLVLHSVFLLALWLWPRPPIKPHERLLEVDLTKVKIPTAVPTPTPRPTIAPRPTPTPRHKVVPPPTPVPLPTATPRPLIQPKLTHKTRIAKIKPRSTPKPIPTIATPIAKPTVVPTVIPTVMPTAQPHRPANTTPTTSPKSTPQPTLAPTKAPKGSSGSQGGGGNSSPPNPNPANDRPTGGKQGRFFARNDGPVEEPNSRRRERDASDDAPKGSNSRGRSNETAGVTSGPNLPRTKSRRGPGSARTICPAVRP